MSRSGSDKDRRIMSVLVETFRGSGYAGASMRELSAATGLTSSSLYHRFADGKAAMGCAAVAHAGTQFDAEVLGPLRSNDTPAEQLSASAAGLRAFYAGGSLACLLAVFALSDAPDEVRESVRLTFAAWREALTATLAKAGSGDPAAEAEDRIAAIQGALILSKAGHGTAAFDRAVVRLGALPRAQP